MSSFAVRGLPRFLISVVTLVGCVGAPPPRPMAGGGQDVGTVSPSGMTGGTDGGDSGVGPADASADSSVPVDGPLSDGPGTGGSAGDGGGGSGGGAVQPDAAPDVAVTVPPDAAAPVPPDAAPDVFGCNGVACDPLGRCDSSGAVPRCLCPPGYADPRGNGSQCEDINECATNNGGCDLVSACTNTPGSFRCGDCPSGYTGSSGHCTDIDECATGNGGCDSRTTCTNIPGARTCGACPPGLTGTGATGCTDIDECLTSNGGCDANATCTNTTGSRLCTCKNGYNGDGISCADINECLTSNGGCDANATCTNTTGSRTCACKNGYAGDGLSCADVNECLASNGGCHASATCTNTTGSRMCACKNGYSGDGIGCSDIDECLTNNGGCGANVCTNTPGSYACCPSGYTGDGVTCVDVNECLTANGGCDANATCSNTVGSRVCTCKNGYTGDGVTCTVAPANPCTKIATGQDGFEQTLAVGPRLFFESGATKLSFLSIPGGGASTPVHTVGTSGYNTAGVMVSDGQTVFYSIAFEPGTGSIWSVKADGTGNIPISQNEAYNFGIAYDATKVYWTRAYVGQYALRRADRNGTNVVTLDPAGSEPRGLVLINGTLYWASQGDGKIYALDAAGVGPRVPFLTGLMAPEQVLTDGSSLIFATRGDGLVRRYEIAAGRMTTLYQGTGPYAGLCTDGASAYGTQADKVIRMPFSGSGGSVVTSFAGAQGVTVDGTYVYSGSISSGDVWRCPK
jgi:hypothetical protein